MSWLYPDLAHTVKEDNSVTFQPFSTCICIGVVSRVTRQQLPELLRLSNAWLDRVSSRGSE